MAGTGVISDVISLGRRAGRSAVAAVLVVLSMPVLPATQQPVAEAAPPASAAELAPIEVAVAASGLAPRTISAVAGQSIRFVNEAGGPVTITATDGSFDSGNVPAGGAFVVSIDGDDRIEFGVTGATTDSGVIVLALAALPGAPTANARQAIPDLAPPPTDAGDLSPHPTYGLMTSRTKLLVLPTSTATVEQVNTAVASVGGMIVGGFRSLGTFAVSIPDRGDLSALLAALEQLNATPGIQAAAPAWEAGLDIATRPAELVTLPRGHESVRAFEAWNYLDAARERSGARPATLVIDAGFDATHQDLNFLNQPAEGADDDDTNHGTHVAGIIGARFENESPSFGATRGINGLDPVVQLYGEKFDSGFGSTSNQGYTPLDLSAAFERVLSPAGPIPRLRVINASFGAANFSGGGDVNRFLGAAGPGCGPDLAGDGAPAVCTPQFHEQFQRDLRWVATVYAGRVLDLAAAMNVVIVKSAGNNGDDFCITSFGASVACYLSSGNQPVVLPAVATNEFLVARDVLRGGAPAPLLVVGALTDDPTPTPADYSQPGGDVSAPGTVRSTTKTDWDTQDVAVNGEFYVVSDGTSMAAPHVTGAISFLQNTSPWELHWSTVVDLVKGTAIPVANGGPPRLDMFGLMSTAIGATALVDVNDTSLDGSERVVRDDRSVPYASAGVVATDGLGKKWAAPDQRVDMRDVRRFRDAWLYDCSQRAPGNECELVSGEPIVPVLDGATTWSDGNRDGCVFRAAVANSCAAGSPDPNTGRESFRSRYDYNGDGWLDIDATADVHFDPTTGSGRLTTSPMTDLDVLRAAIPSWLNAEGWTGTYLKASGNLRELLVSGDVHVRLDRALAGSGDAQVWIDYPGGRLNSPVSYQQGSLRGVFTVPVDAAGSPVKVWASGTVNGTRVVTPVIEVADLSPGEDVVVSPCAAVPQVDVEATYAERAELRATFPGCGSLPVGQQYADGKVELSIAPAGSGAPTLAPTSVDLQGKLIARTTLTEGADDGDWTVTAKYVQPTGGSSSGSVVITTVDPIQVRYTWRARLVSYDESGSNNWPGATPDMPDCDLAGTLCIDSYTATAPAPGGANLVQQRSGTLVQSPEGVRVTETIGGGNASVTRTYTWSQADGQTGQATETSTIGLVPGQANRYSDHLLPATTTMRAFTDGIVLAGLGAVSELGYQGQMITSVVPSNAPDSQVLGVPPEFFLEPDASGDSIRYAASPDRPIRFVRTGVNAYTEYVACPVIDRSLDAGRGYRVADPSAWVAGASDLGRDPVYDPGDVPMPITSGRIVLQVEFAATATADGTTPPAPTLPDCATPVVPTAAFELLPQPDGSLDEGDTLRFRDLSTGTDIVSHQWSFGDGRMSTAQDPVVAGYPDNGEYTVTLTVTTSRGLTATTTKRFTVNNVAPTIEASPPIVVVDAGQPIRIGVIVDDRGRTDRTQLRIDAYVPGLPGQGRTVSAGLETITLGVLPPGQYLGTVSVSDPSYARATAPVTVVVLPTSERRCDDGSQPPCEPERPVLSTTCGPTISLSAWESDFLERLSADRRSHVAPEVGPSKALTDVAAEAARRTNAGLPIDLDELRALFGYTDAGRISLLQIDDATSGAAALAQVGGSTRQLLLDPEMQMIGVARVSDGANTAVFVALGTAVDCDDPAPVAGSAPTLTISPPATVFEGTNFALGLVVGDPDGDLADVVVDLGGDAISGGGLHRYVQDGTYDITVTAVDEQGNSTTRTARIVVTDVAPAARIEVQGPAVVGQPLRVTAFVVDRSEADVPLSYTISSPILNDSGRVRANGSKSANQQWVITPTAAGPLTFTATFTSPDGVAGTASTTVTVSATAPAPATPPPNVTLSAPVCTSGVPVRAQVADYLVNANAYRSAQSLPTLSVDPALTAAAEAHLAYLVANQAFLHVTPEGSTPESRAQAAGYTGLVGENLIAMAGTANQALAGWQMSPGHHRNLLDPRWTATGVAVANSPMGVIWVQLFGDTIGCPTGTPPPAPTPEVLANPPVTLPFRILSSTMPETRLAPEIGALPAIPARLVEQAAPVTPPAAPTATVAAYVVSDVNPLTGELVTVTNRSRGFGAPVGATVGLPGGATRALAADGSMTTRFLTSGASEVSARVALPDGTLTARGALVVAGDAIAPNVSLSPVAPGSPVPGVLGGPFEATAVVVDVNGVRLAGRTVRLYLVADPTVATTAITGDDGTVALALRLDVPSAGDWQVRADVLDDRGQVAASSNVVEVRVTANLTAIVEPGGPYLANLGDSVTFDASNSYDPGVGGAVTGATWDLDGDGLYGDVRGLTVEVQWPILERLVCRGRCETDRDYPIGAQVTDEVGATSVGTTTLRFRRDYGIFVGPESQAIPPGGTNQFLVSIVTTSGFDEEIDLTAPGLPAGVTVSFWPSRVRAGQQSTMTVTLASTFQGVTSFDLNVRGLSRTTGVERIASPTVSVVFGLVPACTTTFRGRVVDDDTGLPVEGVAIQGVRGTALTDVDGRWEIDAVPLGYNNGQQQYWVYTSKDGYWSTGELRTATCGLEEGFVHRIKPVKTVPVRLHAAVGETDPRNPSKLRLTDGIPPLAGYWGYGSAVVSGRGPGFIDLELPLASGNTAFVPYYLGAEAPGYWWSYVQDPPTLTLADVGGPRIDLWAPLMEKCTGRISGGTVFDPAGRPVAGADVQMTGRSTRVVTGADGRFPGSGPIELSYRNSPVWVGAWASPPAGLDATSGGTSAVLDGCGTQLELDIRLPKPSTPAPPPPTVESTISGTVTDGVTGVPMSGVQVYVEGTYATTGADGVYSATVPIGPAGSSRAITVGTYPTGYWAQWKYPTVVAGQPATVDLSPQPVRFGAVEVVVRDLATGLPIADALTYVDGRYQTTGPDGRLRWDGVRLATGNQPQLQYVWASHQGYWDRYVYTEVRADETSFVDLGLLRECQPAEVRGLVLDAVTQLPLEAATVYGPTGTALTAADGTFSFTGIRMQSQNTPWQFTMTATKTGYLTQSKTVNVFCGARVVVEYGPAPSDPGVLEGIVTRADTGAPVVGATVGTDWGGYGVTDAAGAYRITGAPTELDGSSKQWGVTAQAPFDQFLHPRSTTVTIDAGATTRADLVLDPLATPNRFPVAATVSPVAGPEGSPITLDARGSSDPDGDAMTFAWDLDGDGQYDDATGPTTTVTYPLAGTQTARVKVTDAALLTDTAPVVVVVTNVAPAVDAGGDASAIAGGSFTRTVTFADPGADTWTAVVRWDDGTTETVPGLTARSFTTGRTFTAPGRYVATIDVSDTKGGSGTASFAVTVEPGAVNLPPTAVVTGATTVDEGAALTLDGTGSTDPDGTIATYAWTIDGAPAGTDARLVVPTDVPATLVIGLTVTDDDGATGSVTRTVTVANVAPALDATIPSGATVGTAVEVPIRATDPGAGPLAVTVDWGAGDGPQPLAVTAEPAPSGVAVAGAAARAYAAAGTFEIVVEVCDPQGSCTTARAGIVVTDPGGVPDNRPPQARIDGPSSTPEGTTVTLSGAASADPDGDRISWAWTVDGAPAGSGPTIDLTARRPGVITIELVVDDGRGASATTTAHLSVTNVAPTITLTTTTTTLQVGGTTPIRVDVADAGDRPLDVTVDVGDGPQTVALTDTAPTTGVAGTGELTFVAAATGEHVVRGEVCDAEGSCAQASVTLVVTASSPPPPPPPPPPANRPPVATIAGAQAILEGGSVELSGRGSSDPDGDALTYRWTLDGAPAGSSDRVTIGPRAHGVVLVALTVDDGRGGTATTTAAVVIGNLAPTLQTRAAPDAERGVAWTLAVDAQDPWSEWIDVRIEWGDGTTSASTQPSGTASMAHVYDRSGTFRVTVTACDADDACGQSVLDVVVRAPDVVEPSPVVLPAPPTAEPPRSAPPVPAQPAAPIGRLPATGSSSGSPLRLALALVAVGLALQWAAGAATAGGRRRRRWGGLDAEV